MTNSQINTLVLTSCVKEKAFPSDDPQIRALLKSRGLDFPGCDLKNEDKYREVLSEFMLPAAQMYRRSFRFIKTLVSRLGNEGRNVDLFILSARYGLINEEHEIIPCECGLLDMKKNEIRQWAKERAILKQLQGVLEETTYEHIIVILGEKYFLALLSIDLDVRANLLDRSPVSLLKVSRAD